MHFKIILFGFLDNIVSQSDELNGFISKWLTSDKYVGSTILFYSSKEDITRFLDLIPTEMLILVKVDCYNPETILDVLNRIEDGEKASLYVFPSIYLGAELSVRWAFQNNGSSLVHAIHIKFLENQLIVGKKVYSDYILGTFRLTKKPYCIVPAKGIFEGVPVEAKKHKILSHHDMSNVKKDKHIKSSEMIADKTKKYLEKSKFILVGGRGMKNKENTAELSEIANSVRADFGVSRPVVMNGWAPMEKLVGVSGTITKPDVCILAAVSGAAAFYAGIEKSKYIIAINNDKNAPIISASDVVIIDDYKKIIYELTKLIGSSIK